MSGHLHRSFVAQERVIHGIVIKYQWVQGEPAMVLIRKRHSNNAAFAICLSAAYQYAEVNYLMVQAVKAAEVLGMHGERYAARHIADIIIEGLPDLVRMKPEPGELEELRVGKRPDHEWDGVNRVLTIH